jgi:hypothetical protein
MIQFLLSIREFMEQLSNTYLEVAGFDQNSYIIYYFTILDVPEKKTIADMRTKMTHNLCIQLIGLFLIYG